MGFSDHITSLPLYQISGTGPAWRVGALEDDLGLRGLIA